MTRHVQFIGANAVTENARIGAIREITVDTDTFALRLHDGVTPGGHEIPNKDNIAGYTTQEFNGLLNQSAPGTLTNAIMRKYNEVTVAGHYVLPLLAAVANVGDKVVICATVAGVIIDRQSTDLISEHGGDVTTLNLVANEIVTLCKKTAARWVVMSRY
jgi:hypothetical protein